MDRACILKKTEQINEARHRIILYLAVFVLSLTLICVFFAMKARSGENALWPEQGSEVWASGDLVIDVSHISQGYFMARAAYEMSQRLKLRVSVSGTTLDYDLPQSAQYIVVPLQMGSDYYQVTLYENISGKKYMEAGSMGFQAQLAREDAAFLYPNQYVDYTPDSPTVAESDKINAGLSAREAFDATCRYITSGFVYDFIKAVTIKPGMLPDIDGSFEKRMGVCQDLSAIMCCMLRTQGIPCRLVIGYADKNYHAWITANVDGEEIFYDPTAALSAISVPMDYSVERYY